MRKRSVSNLLVFLFIITIISSLTSAESFLFEASNDEVELSETFDEVLPSITSQEISLLKSSKVTTQSGSTDANQYIRFGQASTALNAPYISYAKSDENEITTFMYVEDGTSSTDAFFEYELEFEEGLKSEISGGIADDHIGATVNIFADEYLIIGSTVDTSSKDAELKLAHGAISDFLSEGEKKIYTIADKKYETELILVDSTNKEARLNINGKEINDLGEGEFQEFQQDVFIGVVKILASSGSQDVAKIFIGAKVIEIKDDDYTDSNFKKGLSVNMNSISSSHVQIKASVSGDEYSITNIKYRLTTTQEIYVGEGKKLSSFVEDGSLLGNFDITFEGMKDVSETNILFDPVGQNEYILKFINSDGNSYSLPLVDNSGTFKLGEDDKDLIVVEGSSTTDYNIEKNDYFILSSGSSKSDDTYVFTYDNIDTASNTLSFTHLGQGSKQVTYTDSTGIEGEGDLNIGSITAKIYIENTTDNTIVIDQNGDGSFSSSAMDAVTKGGAIIDLGSTNSISSPYQISLKTEASSLEESSSDENVVFQITDGTSLSIPTSFTGVNMLSGSNQYSGMTNYGSLFTLEDTTSSTPETLKIKYPTSQRFAEVYINVDASSQISTSTQTITTTTTCNNGILDAGEEAIDCGGSCDPCEQQTDMCSNGIQDITEEGIDCGGPCPNTCAEAFTTPLETLECPGGCVHIGEDEKVTCLNIGEAYEKFYCSDESALKELKKNHESCNFGYECKSQMCENSKCGKKVTIFTTVLNILLIVLLLVIIYSIFKIFKE